MKKFSYLEGQALPYAILAMDRVMSIQRIPGQILPVKATRVGAQKSLEKTDSEKSVLVSTLKVLECTVEVFFPSDVKVEVVFKGWDISDEGSADHDVVWNPMKTKTWYRNELVEECNV